MDDEFRELLNRASDRLEAVYSRAMKLVQKHYRGVEQYPKEFRIAVIAYAKLLVELMKIEKMGGEDEVGLDD